MRFSFFDLVFEITDDKIFWRSFGKLDFDVDNPFVEVGVAGEIKPSHMGAKLVCSSEGDRLKYISHSICAKKLTIIQRSTVVETVTVFEYLSDAHAFRAYTEVKNITDGDVTLEDVSSLVLPSLCSCDNTDGMYITRFWQGHHTECQPRRLSFDDLGFFGNAYQPAQQKKIEHTNIGSWSTKEAIPEAIIENLNLDIALMFQIESSSSWHYEISDRAAKTYLYLGGASNSLASWHKTLSSGESYRTSSVSLAISRDVQGVIAEMTKHRRAMRGVFPADQSLPTIFNEYMHLSWDSPTAENTKIYAPAVADLGVEYYVIDCGWHDEESGDKIYPYVGGWRESRARFPEGVRKTLY